MAHIQHACGMCGEAFDEKEDALNHCPESEWAGSGPRYTNEVTSCCYGEVGTGTRKEHPLGRNTPWHLYYEIPVCCECGRELDE